MPAGLRRALLVRSTTHEASRFSMCRPDGPPDTGVADRRLFWQPYAEVIASGSSQGKADHQVERDPASPADQRPGIGVRNARR